MSWVSLSIDDLSALFDEGEASLVGADAQSLGDCLADATARAREAVAANAANALAADTASIPRSLRQHVLAIARRDLLLRYALPITTERAAAATAAEAELADITSTKRAFLGADGQRNANPAARPYVTPESVAATRTSLF